MKLVLITKTNEYPAWPVLVLSVLLNVLLIVDLADRNGLIQSPHGALAERMSRFEITGRHGQVATDAAREVLSPGLAYGRPKKYPELAAGLIERAGFRCKKSAREFVSDSYLLVCENPHAGYTSTGCERHWKLDVEIDRNQGRRTVKDVFALVQADC